MTGYLDPTSDHCLRGWAWDPSRAYERVLIDIDIDGLLYGPVRADGFRPDLIPAGIGDGRHGFELDLPPHLLDGKPHLITARGLSGSPLTFESLIEGHADDVTLSSVGGWLRDRLHPHARLSMMLYADGICVGQGRTDPQNRFRIPLAHGFDTARVRRWSFQRNSCATSSATVDVIVPVYAGIEETLATLEHAAAAQQKTPFELIAILDNPDDVAMSEALLKQQSRLGYTLLCNQSNLGFVRTVNRGMALHPDRDVVLLNADTIVKGDWIDRLRKAVYGEAHTGTATPFSNNATICSYPRFCFSNPVADHDEVFQQQFTGQVIEIPTAVGFCMYIRRECLGETGLFDAVTFGRGYGEENDFCMRSRRLGWRHVLAADVYVGHVGHVSFGGGAGFSSANAAKLSALHPEYDALVADFIECDPIRPLRRTLDIAAIQTVERVCIATNTLQGGNERHVQNLLERHKDALLLRYEKARYVTLDASPNFVFDLLVDRELLRDTLLRCGVTRIHINQMVDAPLAIFELGIPYEITVHDYAWICPQVTLQDATGEYCGEPHIRHCEACYQQLGPHKDWGSLLQRVSSVEQMRRQNCEALERAECVTFPSEDIRARMSRYVSLQRVAVTPHDDVKPAARRPRRSAAETRIKVVYIGSLGYAKGFAVFYNLALDALKRRLPLDFVVIGSAADSRPLLDLGVKVLGYYQESAEAREWIDAESPHLALFPGVLPESFSYTLSIAFAAGLYPVAFDLGAIGERIRTTGFGALLPLGSTSVEINEILLREA